MLANLIFRFRLILERIVENIAWRVQLYKMNVNPNRPIIVCICKWPTTFHRAKVKMTRLIKNHILILSPLFDFCRQQNDIIIRCKVCNKYMVSFIFSCIRIRWRNRLERWFRCQISRNLLANRTPIWFYPLSFWTPHFYRWAIRPFVHK